MKSEKIWTVWQYVKTIAATGIAGAVVWTISNDSVLPFYAGLFLKATAVAIVLSGLLLAFLKDIKSRKYECGKCHLKFTPDVRCFRLFSRRQTCPHCAGDSSFCGRETRQP